MLNCVLQAAFYQGKGFLSAYSLQAIMKGDQGRNLGAETDAEAMEEHCLPAYSSWLSACFFLQNPGPPFQEWHHPQWAGSSSINHQSRKACPQTDLMEALSELRFALPR